MSNRQKLKPTAPPGSDLPEGVSPHREVAGAEKSGDPDGPTTEGCGMSLLQASSTRQSIAATRTEVDWRIPLPLNGSAWISAEEDTFKYGAEVVTGICEFIADMREHAPHLIEIRAAGTGEPWRGLSSPWQPVAHKAATGAGDQAVGRSEDCLCPPPTLSQADVAQLSADSSNFSVGVDVRYGECLMKLYSGDWDHYELLDVMLLAGYAPESPAAQLALQAAFLVTKRQMQAFVDAGSLGWARECLHHEARMLKQIAEMLLSQAAELDSWSRSLGEKMAPQNEIGGAS